MAREIHRMPDGSYTMRAEFEGQALVSSHPPKFSPDDRLARFRYAEKRAEWLAEHSE